MRDALHEGPYGHLKCRSCGATVWQNPAPVALALVADTSGPVCEVLLIKRRVDAGAGLWALPGGFVEPHEDPARSALRELAEETGLDGTDPHLVAVVSGTEDNTVLIAYRLRVSGRGTGAPGDGEVLASRWFPVDALPPMAFPAHVRLVEAAPWDGKAAGSKEE